MSTPVTANDVRAWGRENGFLVSDRGRLSFALITAYNKANRKRKYDLPPKMAAAASA